jgi:acyl carrier protein
MSGAQDTDPLALVLDALRHVLGGESPLAQDTDLFALPGFDSLALEALVTELENRIGRPVDDDLVTPEVFATPGTIARGLVSASLRGEGG